ncbi:MAG: ribbon-helix-helix protein, CopG family [Lachnospiraceae bacterium]|nr:ribbon-helix-helix protein, CopG family [Lachnospiraceae bacterium]MBQ9902846.1 ribbon-helix-helix protein, CopG family [Clostridia bacterium]
MKNEPLVIRKRGEDGTKVISVRLPQEIVDALDRIAAESNHSRNEIINIILSYGIENLQIL